MWSIPAYVVVIIVVALLLPSCSQSPEPEPRSGTAEYLDGVGNCILENRDAVVEQAVMSNDGVMRMHDEMVEMCGFDMDYLAPEARDWYEQQTAMSVAVIEKWQTADTFTESAMDSIKRTEYFEMALMMQVATNLSDARNSADERDREIALELLLERHASAIEVRTRRLIDPFAVMQ